VQRILKTGNGWRIGWNPSAPKYQGLLGTDNWAIELTEAEFNDFCRLFTQLTETIKQIADELMDEEKISLEAESDLVWMEINGDAQSYSLRLILNSGRGVEAAWEAEAVPGFWQAVNTLQVF
jgi:hypothetical protein